MGDKGRVVVGVETERLSGVNKKKSQSEKENVIFWRFQYDLNVKLNSSTPQTHNPEIGFV